MEVRLIVVGGKANKDAITLKPPATIGRCREAELTVAHPMISRRHCEIFEIDGLLMIRDLGSLNGTVVEGQPVSESPLCPGNEFTLGPLTFRVEYEYEGDLASMPAPKIVEEGVPPLEAESDEEVPNLTAVDETPYFPDAVAPTGTQSANGNQRDQMATKAVHQPGEEDEEVVIEIDELTVVEDEEEPEPTPPPPPRGQKQVVEDAPRPPPPKDHEEGLDRFLKGLP